MKWANEGGNKMKLYTINIFLMRIFSIHICWFVVVVVAALFSLTRLGNAFDSLLQSLTARARLLFNADDVDDVDDGCCFAGILWASVHAHRLTCVFVSVCVCVCMFRGNILAKSA